MLPQQQMIARVRELCRTDARIDAAMMYGSFTYGEADQYSDIEFLFFFNDEAFEQIDPRAWLTQIAPVAMLYVNDFGIHAAVFENLVRGEFHFHRASEVTIGAAWPGVLTFPRLDATLIVDRSGALTPYLEAIIGPHPERATPDAAQNLVYGFINWLLFGFNVLRRGERARAHEILNIIHRHLLHMVRLGEGATDHWLTPSRLLEHDLSPEVYARFEACVPHGLTPEALRHAYGNAWAWGGDLMGLLRARFDVQVPDDLCETITIEFSAPKDDDTA